MPRVYLKSLVRVLGVTDRATLAASVHSISTQVSYQQSIQVVVAVVTDTKYMHIYTIQRSFYALAIKLQKQWQQQQL